jgi:diguanylate cyclase (GGDEF)-like protein/PAS domain S-box-containing protein
LHLADFTKILTLIPIPSFIFQDKRIMFANKNFTEITGYTEQELNKIAPGDFIHPDDMSNVLENIVKCYTNKETSQNIEFRAFAHNGETAHVLGHFAFIELNGLPAILVQCINISMRKQAEASLRIQRDLIKDLSSCSKLTDALNLIIEAVVQVDGIDCGEIYLVDRITGNLEMAAHTGISDNFPRAISFLERDIPQAILASEGRTIYGNISEEVFLKNQIAEEGLQAFISVPVLHDGKAIAVLALASHTVYEFTLKDRNLIEGIAAHIGPDIYRIKTEKKLNEIRDDLQSLFNTIDDFLFILDNDGLILSANLVSQEHLGYSADELESLKVFDLLPPGRKEELETAIANLLDNKTASCSIPMVTKSGIKIFVESKITKGRWANKDVLFCVSRDITWRKEAEEGLFAEKHKFKTLTEHSPYAVAMFDKKGTYNYINPKFKEIFGYDLDDIPDRETWYEKAYPDPVYRQKVVFFWEKEVKNTVPGEKNAGVFTVLCKDGIEKRISFTPVKLYNDEFLITCEDITQRKLAERKLKSAHQELVDIVDFLPDATFVIDKSGRVIFWNKAIEEMTGVTKGDIVGKGDYAYAVPFYGEPRPILIDFVLESQIDLVDKYENVQRIGRTLYSEAYVPSVFGGKGANMWGKASSLLDGDGNVIGAIESIRDITEKKKAEEKLKYLTLHDPLTGLYNRTLFEEKMRRVSDVSQDSMGIIVCDMDGLKLVNDTLGHDTGDSLLVKAAGIIAINFRKGDIVSRIGGDEFAVILPHSTEKTVEEACARLRSSFDKYNATSPDFPLNISIGYAVGNIDTTSIKDLFKEADNNMYREKLTRSQSSRSAIVQTLMKAMEERDFITEGHAVRLHYYVKKLALVLGMTMRHISDLSLLSKFHDIGKVGVPDRILFKPSTLTTEEMLEMQRHCEIGHRIAQSAPDLTPIADWILKHHEWWNGEGYPLGLKGEAIPLECRILAIVDAYDAMTNDRPYRKALNPQKALIELIRCSGTQFDPCLVSKFVDMLEQENNIPFNYHEEKDSSHVLSHSYSNK